MLLQVALPVPLYRVFDYSLPADTNALQNITSAHIPPIGSRVEVSFGRQTLIGIVIAHIAAADSDVPLNKLKPINKCLDAEPILDTSMLKLAHWLARYYHYPLGDVLAVMLPTLVRQGKPLDLLITHCFYAAVKASLMTQDQSVLPLPVQHLPSLAGVTRRNSLHRSKISDSMFVY